MTGWPKTRFCASRTNTSASPIGLKSRHGILRPFRSRGFIRSFRIPEGVLCASLVEGIVSKRKGPPYRSGHSPDWLKMKNPDAPAVKREVEEDWDKEKWR